MLQLGKIAGAMARPVLVHQIDSGGGGNLRGKEKTQRRLHPENLRRAPFALDSAALLRIR